MKHNAACLFRWASLIFTLSTTNCYRRRIERLFNGIWRHMKLWHRPLFLPGSSSSILLWCVELWPWVLHPVGSRSFMYLLNFGLESCSSHNQDHFLYVECCFWHLLGWLVAGSLHLLIALETFCSMFIICNLYRRP